MSPHSESRSPSLQPAPRPRLLLLYAITAALPVDREGSQHSGEPGDAPVLGVQAAPVTRLQEGAVAALVSELPDRRCLSAPSCADILSFDGVLERFGIHQTLLPVPFGTTASSEASLREILRARARDYLHSLMEMDGCAEMCVRLLPGALSAALGPGELAASRPGGESGNDLGGDSGSRHARSLQTRRQQLDRVYALAGRYLEHFAPWVLRHRIEYSFRSYAREGEPVLSLHFLIPRTATQAFEEACRALGRLRPSRVLLSGPSPPLTFVPSLPLLAAL
ncbi:MAG: GvpL/GvpF family gas vesicle protein [Polyangia bacterium]